ncbi:MAG: hypothetical protein IT257_02055, partial [Chitinophagaceae bacterium]|nr:hypothetical protein [Chitinophagaceae bacterium]
MNKFYKYLPLLLSLAVYLLLWIIMQPILGYNLDSDCVAYLTIAKRVASGDYFKSINGLWSPLNSWLVAIGIRNGLDAWWSAKIINCVVGALLLVQSFFLFLRFKCSRYLCYYLQLALSIAMVYFVYFQMFGDLLQMIFVLAYLFVLWHKSDRPVSYGKAILCGVIMGLAFYAKAYSFFFFILHFSATIWWYIVQQKLKWQAAVPLILAGLFFAMLTILPWTIALHQKYHEWSLNGHAGKLNMSWYINSGKTFRSDIDLLIPPSYQDSPSFWEDPYLSQQNLSSPFTSAEHFIRWVIRIAHTCIVTVFCFQEISFMGLALLLLSLYYYWIIKRKEGHADSGIFDGQLLVMTICILPLGYLMMHIETRYIWLNGILLMVLGAILYDRFASRLQKVVRHILPLIFAISFVVFPLYQFENLSHKNEDLFNISASLREQNIHGSFTSNTKDAGRMWVIALLTHSQYFTIEKTDFNYAALMAEMKRYNVKYYFFESENNIAELNIEGMTKI